MSRGGLLALVAGAGAAVVLVGGRRFAIAAAPPIIGALVALGGLAPSFDAESQPRPALAVASLAAGLAVTWWCAVRPSRAVWATRVLVAAGSVAVAVMTAATVGVLGGGGLSLASPDRVEGIKAALASVADRPLIGVGPGAAELRWSHGDDVVMAVRYVHNEYLQVLTEYGAVGLVLVAVLLAVMVASLRRGRGTDETVGTSVGVAAGLVGLGVHSALDFLWHVPIIALTAALLVGLATPIDINKEE